MKILVLATDYTNLKGKVASHFIHSRNLIYKQNGIEVTVLSFATKENYNLEGIEVISLHHYKNNNKKYDILLSHAPNIRNHYKFLRTEKSKFENIYYYFHGHEVLISSKVYPRPYNYMGGENIIKKFIIEMYDRFKLKIWKRYFSRMNENEHLIFVSEWMKSKFDEFVGLDPMIYANNHSIIYNCIGEVFEKNKYNKHTKKEIDFITIRNILDLSKYAIDKVVEMAEQNPKFNFVVVGKGDFFNHYSIPKNLSWIDKNLNHEEIISMLNKSKYALLPTRADAQGVMACEMATFGIPLFSSNIDVNHEVLGSFENVRLFDNDSIVNLENLIDNIPALDENTINTKFYIENTVLKEINLFIKT